MSNYANWLSQKPTDKTGKYENNRQWVLSLWSNPHMINDAKTIYEAGRQDGLAQAKYYLSAAANAISE